ncbi:uncharacterized protein LOC142334339 [Lycorma delicatula]|uniref:uncharacterized protein LOC142334339 n=1 Tax=Lycorma delicatula TaxID=130591 RepID=UPI003F50FC74
MTVLPPVFFKGFLLIAVCCPSIIWGSDLSVYRDYKGKKISSTTVAGEEEASTDTLKHIYSSENLDELTTVFDSKHKSTITKLNKNTFNLSSPQPLTNSYPKENEGKLHKLSEDLNGEKDGELFAKKVTIKYNEETSSPALNSNLHVSSSSSLPLINKKYNKNFDYKNDELTSNGGTKTVKGESSYEYPSKSISHINGNVDDGNTEEPDLHSSTPKTLLDYKNLELKSSELKKKNSKKETSVDNDEVVEKITSMKTDKSFKDQVFKTDKLHIKDHYMTTLKTPTSTTAIIPDALDDNYSTINISVIGNDKTVKNISVNNESGSNLLEVELISSSSEVSKNPKNEGVSNTPQSVNSVIIKNSVTAENIESLNRTPTIKYSLKESGQNIINRTAESISLRGSETSYDKSTKEPSSNVPLKLDESKNTIPILKWEQSTEPTLYISTKSTKVPVTDVLSLKNSTNEDINDIKKKIIPTKKQQISLSSQLLPVNDSNGVKDIETTTSTAVNVIPRLNIALKNKLSSTVRMKSLPTSTPSGLSSVWYQMQTLLPTIENYTSTSEASTSNVKMSTEMNTSDIYTTELTTVVSNDNLTKPITVFNTKKRPPIVKTSTEMNTSDKYTELTTVVSNDNLTKPITGFSMKKRPPKLSYLTTITTPTVMESEINPTITPSVLPTKTSNYSDSSFRSSRRPSSINNISVHNFNRTVSHSTTETVANIKPFIQWSTHLQKLNVDISANQTTTTAIYSDPTTTETETDLPSEHPTTDSYLIGLPKKSADIFNSWEQPLSPSLSSSNNLNTDETTTASSSPDLQPSTPTTFSNIQSSVETSDLVTPSLFSSSTLSSELHNFPDMTESVTTDLVPSIETNFKNSSVIENAVTPGSSSLYYTSEDINLKNFSETTKIVSVNLSSSFPNFTEIPLIHSTADVQNSSFEDTPTVQTNTEGVGVTTAITDEGISDISLLSTNETSSLYTSESVIPSTISIISSTINESSSAIPEYNVSDDNLITNETKYFSVTESALDNSETNSTDEYSLNNVTESTLSILTSTSLPSSVYTIDSANSSPPYDHDNFATIKSIIKNNNSLMMQEITTLPTETTNYETATDENYDPEDNDDLSNVSDHHVSKINQQPSTVSSTEHVALPPVNPTYSDSNTDLDEEDENFKNESYNTEIHQIKIDDLTTEFSKSNPESTTLTVVNVAILVNNSSVNNTASENPSHEGVTTVPVKNVSSSVSDAVFSMPDIETTTLLTQTQEEETTFIQYNKDGASVPMSPKWTINDVPEHLVLKVDTSWAEMCHSEENLKRGIIRLFKNGTGRSLRSNQIAFLNLTPDKCSQQLKSVSVPIKIEMIFLNESGGSVSSSLNKNFLKLFKLKRSDLDLRVQDVQLMRRHQIQDQKIDPNDDMSNTTAVAAIAIFCVAIVCLLLLGILLVILRKRQKGFNYGQRCTPVSLDDYSLDNISVNNSVRRKNAIRASKRSYGNPAFDDPVAISHPLNFAGLANFCTNRKSIDEEFSQIPVVSPKMDELPPGAETKNRYANVIPLPETRVYLSVSEGEEPLTEYINANYIKGPKGEEKFYIACQAPMQSTVNDFWKMIWEQQCKIILMLTDLHENGVEKCCDYLPPSEILDCHRLFGDYQVTLKKREVREKYIISLLQLKNLETNLWREVTHMWYLSWPHQGVPDEGTSVIAFLIEARSYMRSTSGPHVVHCSPGTGRTGTVLAIDLCIRDFETNRLVDIPKTVYALRRDRAGAVQTKDQYAYIYQVLNIYAAKLTGGALDSI